MSAMVSVIIPVHDNEPRFIREAVESALGQTYEPVEVIVVDDGSTNDMTWLRGVFKERIRLVRKPNGGPASARNAGLSLARGEYAAFLDADDLWEPTKLAEQVRALQEAPSAGLAYSAVLDIDRQGRSVPGRRPSGGPSGWIAEALFMKNVVPTSSVIVRRACFERVGQFDEAPELISVEDYDMWLRLAEQFEAICLERPLTRYRAHAGGISRNIRRSYEGEALVIAKALRRPGVRLDGRRLSRRMARMWFDCGHEHFTVDALPEARHSFGKALAARPWCVKAVAFWCATWLGRPGVEAVRRLKAGGRVRGEPAKAVRVLHVLNTVDTGGAEHVVLNLAGALDRRRHELMVCSLTTRGSLASAFEAAGVPVVALERRPGVALGLCRRIAALIRRHGIDVVHTHNAAPWLYGGLAAKWAGVRLVHTEHSNLFAHQRRLQQAERWLARISDAVIADSMEVRRVLLAQGLPGARVRTVWNGIDTERFAPVDRSWAWRQLSLNGVRRVLGTVGRLVPVKDHATLLKAFSRVRAALPGTVLVVVGDGPLKDTLKYQAASLGLQEDVRFVGERPDVHRLLPAFDLFALSSVSEGLPLTVLEAMACGKPVVATRVGGLPEVVTEATGRLVPPGDPEALAEALLGILSNPERCQRMGAAARERAREQFDVRRMAQAYETAYRH